MAIHAKLSPSAAHRWMNCPGSIAKIGDEPSTAGMPAMMGTAAHKVIEFMLQNSQTNAADFQGYIVQVEKAGTEESLIFSTDDPLALSEKPGWFAFPVNDEMVYGVQTMIDEVERVRAEMTDPVLYTERFLDMTWLDSRLGGTADVTLIDTLGDEWIHLFDYKNGRVVVEVVDNEQMKNYAVGLLHEHPGAAGVIVHLVQPNAVHEDGIIRTAQYTAAEIRAFEAELKQAADETSKPNAPLRAGDWCMYCPAKGDCEAFASLALQEAAADFGAEPEEFALPVPELIEEATAHVSDENGEPVIERPETYTDATEYRAALARKARWIPLLDQWARDIRSRIQVELCNRNPVGDWKLVRGRSNRQWSPDEATVQTVFNNKWGIPDDYLFEAPKMKSPAQIEKAAIPGKDKKMLKKIVESLAVKPPGKLSIAPGSDPREAVDPVSVAAADFANDQEEFVE